MVRRLRILTQALFFGLFLFLLIQTESKGNDELGYPVKIFLDIDPLVFVATFLSSHHLEGAFYLSLITLVVTAIAGRFFCGWLCPLGSLNNLIGLLNKRPQKPKAWHSLKYYLLAFLVVTSVFSVQFVGVFDPISLIIRSFSVSVYPAFNWLLNGLISMLYYSEVSVLVTISNLLEHLFKKTVLAFSQPYYLQSLFIGLIFVAILALNLVEKRFWCRYLCPLGALLGLISRFAFVGREISEGCTSCGKCERHCPSASSPQKEDRWQRQECFMCFNCDDLCPTKAVTFKSVGLSKHRDYPMPNIQRRKLLFTTLTALITVPMIKTSPRYKDTVFNPQLIRPPGALNEKEFLSRCVKCGECMKVCITNGLQPTLFEAGIEGIWTPMLVPKIGYCEYRCTLCGQVCPTGAIKRLTLKQKAETKIGLAMIDKGRCLPYAHGRPCIVCEEVCPTPKKAIWFVEVKQLDREGRPIKVMQPVVDTELCIGCGICETKCPVMDRPAIYVTSIGESRSSQNQLLLDL